MASHVGTDVKTDVAACLVAHTSAYAVAALGARSIAVSRTGKFTKPAKTPKAMEMYQTMS